MPQEHSSANPSAVPDEPRGIHIHIERGRLGFDHTLLVRRSKNGVPHELQDGATVTTGDRIRVSIQTSEDAYLYLAFCAHKELAVYPSPSGIRTRAGELIAVPPADAELVFDGDPGTEVLYVILSRTEISVADPKLAQMLAAKRPSNMQVDCGTNLNALQTKPSSAAGVAKDSTPSSKNVLRGVTVRKQPMPPPHVPNEHRPTKTTTMTSRDPGSGSSARKQRSTPTDASPSPPPNPQEDPDFAASNPPRYPDFERDLERNPGAMVWYRVDDTTGPVDLVAADDDGIAVVRHTFIHVAQTSPP